MRQVSININGKTFIADVADNETTDAFLDILPLDVDMQELNGNEKYFRLLSPLPSSPKSFDVIEAGDVMLYQDDYIVIFYETHTTSYTYTRIGKIEDAEGLAEAAGSGIAQVNFQLI